MKTIVTILIVLVASVAAWAQAPTLQIVTVDPSLPSELFYGSVKVKPLRVRPGSNPPQFITIDDTDFFTQEQYIDFLSRMPDQSGFNFWMGQITNCGSNAQCIEVQRINVSGSFFLSIEFKETGYLVERTYKAAFGDANPTSTLGGTPHNIVAPIVRFNQFIPDVKQIGQGVIVLQPGWEALLENNKIAYFNSFVQRSAFTTAYPAGMTPAQFVDQLNSRAENPLSTAERDQLVADLTSGSKTRAQVLRAVAEDNDLLNSEFNRAFVLMQYFGYLRRNPNDAPEAGLDYSGYEFWLNKLNGAHGDFIQAEMVKAFLSSIEYRDRF